jgi:hypothetical protein
MIRQPDFAGVWIKVDRAKHHFRDLQARYERFQEAKPYRAVAYDEPDTGDFVHRVEVSEQPPLFWSAIAGDCVHNLRSSLDLLVCEMVRANDKPVRKRTGFPVFGSEASYSNAFDPGPPGGIKEVPQCAVDLIKKAKPYNGADNPFWRLHQLDIEDKHKLLVPVGTAHKGTINSYTMADVLEAYPDATTINLFEMPTAQGIGISVLRLPSPLKDGAEIYRVPARLRDTRWHR